TAGSQTFWTLSFYTSQSGNIDNTHTSIDPNGPAGVVKCGDGSGTVNLGSDQFSGGPFTISCPVHTGVLFYKWTNWGGGCCGGYNRSYYSITESYEGCN